MTNDDDVRRLIYGETDLGTTTRDLRVLWVLAFGHGRESMRPALDDARAALERAEADADRYYTGMCRRTPPRADLIVPAEMWRARGDRERAERIEAARRAWFGGAA